MMLFSWQNWAQLAQFYPDDIHNIVLQLKMNLDQLINDPFHESNIDLYFVLGTFALKQIERW